MKVPLTSLRVKAEAVHIVKLRLKVEAAKLTSLRVKMQSNDKLKNEVGVVR
jgi:hypothetical protein